MTTPHPAPPAEQVVLVRWYDHACDWVSKYCDEHHVRTARVPVQVLQQYTDTQASGTDAPTGTDAVNDPDRT